MTIQVVLFGGANVDIKARTVSRPVLETSNPVKTTFYFGGVARNIAENLARLKVSVSLISRVGKDPKGEALIKECIKLGISVQGVSYSEHLSTGTFTALIDEKGELFIAMADMEIYEELNPFNIKHFLNEAKKAPFWLVDGNLNQETLTYIASEKPEKTELWAMPASYAKAKKLRALLPSIDTLILNTAELHGLVDQPINNDLEIQSVCQNLRASGVKSLLVTKGKDGVFIDSDEMQEHISVPKIVPVDALGAGDSFSSGLLFGRQKGLNFKESISYGLAMATLALQTHHSLPENLSLDSLVNTVETLELANF